MEREASGWAPLVIAVAPNGARKTAADHPRLPVTPAEIARESRACLEAGASMLHLHVRDSDGAHTLDPARYRAAIDAVRAEVGDALVIQTTTEAVGRYTPDEQIAAVRALKPEAVSLAVRELMPDAAREPAGTEFLRWCEGEGVMLQFILYDTADLVRFRDLTARGAIPGRRHFVLYVLGRYAAGQQSQPRDLLPFLCAEGGLENPWMLCAFGAKETACATTAATLGGHVRVGFENNMLLPDGRRAPDNAALVAAAAEGARAIGRPLAKAADLRAFASL
ncbi:3-keto-5-aminohexanoate cleavage protein [Ferruginivarius sediminum]|uniref:3-keto-5-aminohexanoate cleavage protein n=1 Tax=Ferruginivarius sediminum TaxID=2661937 RepID=A0A369T8T9_9PROT|nr:3-keto-5-aminohexanoate cleavage protein [Ferruginivarius sediminum]RDD61688.1 3-keto-5-aminohexanoate cleavage protein [Ferruginivarius sediminum]